MFMRREACRFVFFIGIKHIYLRNTLMLFKNFLLSLDDKKNKANKHIIMFLHQVGIEIHIGILNLVLCNNACKQCDKCLFCEHSIMKKKTKPYVEITNV